MRAAFFFCTISTEKSEKRNIMIEM